MDLKFPFKAISIAFLIISLVLTLFSPSNAAVISSVQDGSWNNPSTWNCSCIPQNGDTVVVSHDIAVAANSQITAHLTVQQTGTLNAQALTLSGTANFFGTEICSSLSLVACHLYANSPFSGGFTVADFNMDATSELVNEMLSSVEIANLNGTVLIVNRGEMVIDLLSSVDHNISNLGNLTIHDSSISTLDLYAAGYALTTLNYNVTDGYMQLVASASVMINGNFESTLIDLDPLGSVPRVEVVGDWTNIGTVLGGGQICVGGISANHGSIAPTPFESLDICDLSATAIQWPFLDINSGSVDSGVTFCQGAACTLSIFELGSIGLNIYPNPFTDRITVDGNIDQLELYDMTGQLLHSIAGNELDQLAELPSGVYLLRADGYAARVIKK